MSSSEGKYSAAWTGNPTSIKVDTKKNGTHLVVVEHCSLKRPRDMKDEKSSMARAPKRIETDAGIYHYQKLVEHIQNQSNDESDKLKTENTRLKRENADLKIRHETTEHKLQQVQRDVGIYQNLQQKFKQQAEEEAEAKMKAEIELQALREEVN